MKTRLLDSASERIWALVFSTGEEAMAGLKQFAQRERLAGSHFTAIGAFESVTLAYFDWETKQYQKIPVEQQVEVVSLIGDIALNEKNEPQIHAHTVVALRDGTTRGGHLMEARVRPTLEVVLEEAPVKMRRKHDPESGLALIDPDL